MPPNRHRRTAHRTSHQTHEIVQYFRHNIYLGPNSWLQSSPLFAMPLLPLSRRRRPRVATRWLLVRGSRRYWYCYCYWGLDHLPAAVAAAVALVAAAVAAALVVVAVAAALVVVAAAVAAVAAALVVVAAVAHPTVHCSVQLTRLQFYHHLLLHRNTGAYLTAAVGSPVYRIPSGRRRTVRCRDGLSLKKKRDRSDK